MKHRNRERGAAAVEFGIALPVLMTLLLGMMEFARGYNSYLTVVAAARDAARYAAEHGPSNTPAVKAIVDGETERLGAALPLSCGAGPRICVTSCTTTDGPCTATLKQWVQVEVCYDHHTVVPVPSVSGGKLAMCSKTKIRMRS